MFAACTHQTWSTRNNGITATYTPGYNSHNIIKVFKIIVYKIFYTEHKAEKNASYIFRMEYDTISFPAPVQ